MIAFCQNPRRRELVLQTPGVNGLDYLEVLGAVGCGSRLALTFLKDARSLALAPTNIALTGDTVLQVTDILPATDEDPLTVPDYAATIYHLLGIDWEKTLLAGARPVKIIKDGEIARGLLA